MRVDELDEKEGEEGWYSCCKYDTTDFDEIRHAISDIEEWEIPKQNSEGCFR